MRYAKSRQSGLTLIELMLSLTLSLFLVLIVAQFFDSNRAAFRTQKALADIQDRGQFALYVLKQQLKQTGFVNSAVLSNSNSSNFPVSGTWNAGQIISGTANSVAVRFRGAGDSNVVNCEGGPVSSGTLQAHAFTNDANKRLLCDNNELLPGITQAVFSYGEDTDSDGIPNSYASAPANWNNVRAVTVCLMVESEEINVSPNPMTVTDCNNAAMAIASNRIARRYETTVYLRNSGRP